MGCLHVSLTSRLHPSSGCLEKRFENGGAEQKSLRSPALDNAILPFNEVHIKVRLKYIKICCFTEITQAIVLLSVPLKA